MCESHSRGGELLWRGGANFADLAGHLGKASEAGFPRCPVEGNPVSDFTLYDAAGVVLSKPPISRSRYCLRLSSADRADGAKPPCLSTRWRATFERLQLSMQYIPPSLSLSL